MNLSSKLIRGVFSSVLLVLVAACLMTPAWGQATSSSSIAGLVTDPQGAVIPGAAVKLQDISTNAIQTSTTNEVGRYVFVNVPSGNYNINFSKEGFAAYKLSSQKVEIGSTLTT